METKDKCGRKLVDIPEDAGRKDRCPLCEELSLLCKCEHLEESTEEKKKGQLRLTRALSLLEDL